MPRRRSLTERRAERELFFWTVRQALLCLFLAAATLYAIACMLNGEAIPIEPLLRRITAG